MKSTREGYGDALLELGASNPDVVVLDADLAKSTTSIKFSQAFPERFIECGIAELNMVNIAAGLAASGKICYTGSFAVFISMRAIEAIRNTICYADLNVKLCPSHSGVSVGEDGASHQTVEDLAIVRSIPNLRVVVPADYYEAKAAVIKAAEIEGPFYIRTGRPPLSFVFDDDYRFEFGKALRLREGTDISIFACGLMVKAALEAADILAQEKIFAEVFNVHTLKPLDEEAVLASARKTGRVVTAEEHSIIGGLGGAVAEALAEKNPVPLRRVGIKDSFGVSGSSNELLKHFGLTAEDIVQAAKDLLKS